MAYRQPPAIPPQWQGKAPTRPQPRLRPAMRVMIVKLAWLCQLAAAVRGR